MEAVGRAIDKVLSQPPPTSSRATPHRQPPPLCHDSDKGILITEAANGTWSEDIRCLMPGNNEPPPAVLLGQMPLQLEMRAPEDDWATLQEEVAEPFESEDLPL
jgi:hypothetical protein